MASSKDHPKKRGKCDACGKDPRVLTTLDSGQRICRTCLRQLRPPRPAHLASANQINRLRSQGFDVDDETTKDEADKLEARIEIRNAGIRIDKNTDGEELARLRLVARLWRRGVKIARNSPAEQLSALESVRHFYTKVAGVTHKNDDGSSRQKHVQKCRTRERLILKRDYDNPYDENAIKVYLRNGSQIGFLSAEVADDVVKQMNKGHQFHAFAANITGGTGNKPTMGVNVLMVKAPEHTPDAAIKQYINNIDWDYGGNRRGEDGTEGSPGLARGCLAFLAKSVLAAVLAIIIVIVIVIAVVWM